MRCFCPNPSLSIHNTLLRGGEAGDSVVTVQ